MNRESPRLDGAPHDVLDCAERARQLRPLIEAHGARIEREQVISPEVLVALYDARLFRVLLPRSCGGEEATPEIFFGTIEELAKADASTAWCVAQAAGGSICSIYLAPEVAHEIFDDSHAVMASGPTDSKAIAVEGGYRVTGAWAFASGIRHATWLAGHCIVHGSDGAPVLDADGKPLERTMLFPKSAAEVTRDWRVMGLKGTGSDRYKVEDLFVRADHTYKRDNVVERRECGTLYRFTGYGLFGVGFAGVALGIARAMLDDFMALAQQKVRRVATATLRENAVVQFNVGLCEAKLQSARALVLLTLRELWEIAPTVEMHTAPQRWRIHMAVIHACLQAREVVDTVYTAAGASAIFESAPFERRFRDMHAVSQQQQAQQANFEWIGQHLLGLTPKTRWA